VYVAGPAEAIAGARDAVQDLCSRSNVAVVVRDAAGADEALLNADHAPGLAEAYVDLRPGLPTRVVVIDAETRQDLERRALPQGSSLEIAIETVAQVVCSAVESSLAARAVAQARAVHAPASNVARRVSTWEARANLFGAAENFGAGFYGGGGAALTIGHGRSALNPAIAISATGFATASVQDPDTNALASFGLIGARVLPMVEWRASPDVTAFFGLGAGVDWTHVTPEVAPRGGASGGGITVADPIGSGMFGARLRLTSSVSALFAVNADVDLKRHSFVVVARDGTRATFFDPARLRPVGIAGLSFSFGSSEVAPSPSAREPRR
jgi:hypothetical protein